MARHPEAGTVLCAVADIPPQGLDVTCGEVRLALVRLDQEVRAYINACAHFGVPLNHRPGGGFVDPATGELVCHVHYARYAAEDGRCLRGACDGDGLRPVPVAVREGMVVVDSA